MGEKIEPVYKQFGLRVLQIREALGLTQEEIATRTGLTRSSVANIEGGRQRVLLLDINRFARAFGCTEKHLLRGIYT